MKTALEEIDSVLDALDAETLARIADLYELTIMLNDPAAARVLAARVRAFEVQVADDVRMRKTALALVDEETGMTVRQM